MNMYLLCTPQEAPCTSALARSASTTPTRPTSPRLITASSYLAVSPTHQPPRAQTSLRLCRGFTRGGTTGPPRRPPNPAVPSLRDMESTLKERRQVPHGVQTPTRRFCGGFRIRKVSDRTVRNTKNQWFYQALFGKYIDREVGGRRVASRSVHDLIRLGKIPKLWCSKVDGKKMCLAWHTKGMCNPGQCLRERDHVEYSEPEYALLSQ